MCIYWSVACGVKFTNLQIKDLYIGIVGIFTQNKISTEILNPEM